MTHVVHGAPTGLTFFMALLISTSASAAGPGSIQAARELLKTAEYDAAEQMLDDLQTKSPTPAEQAQIDKVRILCHSGNSNYWEVLHTAVGAPDHRPAISWMANSPNATIVQLGHCAQHFKELELGIHTLRANLVRELHLPPKCDDEALSAALNHAVLTNVLACGKPLDLKVSAPRAPKKDKAPKLVVQTPIQTRSSLRPYAWTGTALTLTAAVVASGLGLAAISAESGQGTDYAIAANRAWVVTGGLGLVTGILWAADLASGDEAVAP